MIMYRECIEITKYQVHLLSASSGIFLYLWLSTFLGINFYFNKAELYANSANVMGFKPVNFLWLKIGYDRSHLQSRWSIQNTERKFIIPEDQF